MAVQYQVNIKVSIGSDFNQEFYLTNPDRSPMDITGYKVSGNIAKHPTSLNAVTSTSSNVVYNYIPFTTRVVDGVGGVFALSLDSYQSSKLKEGKYVYNTVITDTNGNRIDTVSGLVFAEVSFGSVQPTETIFEGGSASLIDDLILDGGEA